MANIKDDFALSLIETEQVGFMILQKSFDDTTGEIRFEFFYQNMHFHRSM